MLNTPILLLVHNRTRVLMRANLLIPMDVHVRKSYQLQLGGFAPDPLTMGSAPGPRWGLRPPDPHYRLALSALAMGLTPSPPK